jgi:hypothetical protein
MAIEANGIRWFAQLSVIAGTVDIMAAEARDPAPVRRLRSYQLNYAQHGWVSPSSFASFLLPQSCAIVRDGTLKLPESFQEMSSECEPDVEL